MPVSARPSNDKGCNVYASMIKLEGETYTRKQLLQTPNLSVPCLSQSPASPVAVIRSSLVGAQVWNLISERTGGSSGSPIRKRGRARISEPSTFHLRLREAYTGPLWFLFSRQQKRPSWQFFFSICTSTRRHVEMVHLRLLWSFLASHNTQTHSISGLHNHRTWHKNCSRHRHPPPTVLAAG